jgi:hypothetical protein
MLKKNRIYQMTPGDYAIFKRAADPTNGVGANCFTSFYFSGRELKPWQWVFHHAAHPQLTVVGGTGSGKTVGAAISYATWAASTPGYSFMGLAPTGWQAKLMYDAILRETMNRPFERFIYRYLERPYPMIVLASDYIGTSTLQFMSASDSAERIQGWEGDSMNGDEFGVLLDATWLLVMMVTRMRGNVPLPWGGFRKRVRRLSIITANYNIAPDWLWSRMDRMFSRPNRFLSMQVKSSEVLDEEELEDMKEIIPIDQHEILLEGKKPELQGSHFSAATIKMCEDWEQNHIAEYHLLRKEIPTPGWRVEELPTIGCTHWEQPPESDRIYWLIGDPGQGNPPHRNAGTLGVFDVTEFPFSPARLIFFKWVFGNMSYNPWKVSFKYAYDVYRPVRAIVDNTGTQKLWTEQILFNMGMWVEGSDFSSLKQGMLIACLQQMQRGLYRFPYINGIRTQLAGYNISKDTESNKLPQDIVVLFFMASWAMRDVLHASQGETSKSAPAKQPALLTPARDTRSPVITPRTPVNGIYTFDEFADLMPDLGNWQKYHS